MTAVDIQLATRLKSSAVIACEHGRLKRMKAETVIVYASDLVSPSQIYLEGRGVKADGSESSVTCRLFLGEDRGAVLPYPDELSAADVSIIEHSIFIVDRMRTEARKFA